MNLTEYKNKKTKEIKHFLRGLNFENIGAKDKEIIEHLTPECSDFFNNAEPVRKATEELLNKINGLKTTLIEIDIEFTSLDAEAAKAEINLAIKKFVDEVRKAIDDYKHKVIKIVFQQKQEEGVVIDELQNVKEDNLIHIGLNFIKIQIGDTIYSTQKNGNEAEKEAVTLDNLNIILIYVYALIGMINNKKDKKEYLVNLNATNFKVTDSRYLEIRKNISDSYFHTKNFDDFMKECDDLEEQIKTGLTKETMLNELGNMLEEIANMSNNFVGISEYEDLVNYIYGAINSKEKEYSVIRDAYHMSKKFLTENKSIKRK